MSLPFSGSVDHNAGASDGNAVLAVPVDPSPGANATKKSSRSRKERGSGAPKRPRTSNKGSETGNSTLSAQRKKGKMEAASVNSPEVSMSPGENKKIKFEAVGDAGNSRRKNEENIAQENQDSVEIEPFSGISKSTKEKIRLLCACAHPSSFEVNLESKKEEFGGTEEKKKLDLVFLGLRKESVALRQDAKHFDGYLFKCVLDEFFSKETAADRLILLGKLLLRLGKIEMISFDFVLSEITSRMEISQLETWNVSCYILLKLFPLCKYTLRERIWNHLIAETSKLPYSLSPSQQEAAEYSLLVLDSILHAANGGIPQDFVMTEKQKYHRIIRSNSNTDSADIIHWILQPFLIPIFKRLNNLEHIISLGTSNAALGSYVFGSVDRLSKYTNSVISQLGYGFEKVSATYYNLLVEHAPLSVFTLDLSPTHVGQVTSSSSSSKDSFQNLRNVSSKRSRETSPTVESKSLATNSQTEPRSAVRRAVLLRIMMLINYLLGRDSTDHDLDVERTLSNSVFEGWKYSWGEWLIFADQVCALIAAKLLDYTELITSIDKMFRSHDLNARFEHYVIWMISQIMPLEIVKQIFQMDLQFNKSSLSLKIMEFYDSSKEPKSDSYGLSEIRDASIVSFILRLKNINPSFQISENIDLIYKKYANWWTEVTDASSNHSIDIYQPTESDLVNVSILSSCSSESVSMYFLSIINKNPESEWADNCSYLPGQILFEGRTKALPTALLFNLSIRCRVRLLMNMEPFIYPSLHDGIDSAKTFSQAKIVSPGFLETYIRLLYTCPYLKGESFYRIINTLKQSNDLNVVHTLVEAINYRLFRILLHRGELINLFVALEDTLSRVRHSQLTDSIQTLLFKISTTYHGIISLIRYKAKAQLNELVSRAVFVGIARSLKIRELSSHHVSDQQLVSFVESYFSSSGRKWSENSIKFFPSSLKKAINYVLKLKQDSFRQKHDFRWELAESEGLNPHISKLKEFTATCSDQVISYLSADSLKRTLFYSAIAFNWIVSLGSSFFEFHYQGVCAKLPQVDCVAGVYALVDVLLDALDRQLLDPYLKLNVVSTVKREPLSLVCELLCVFIEQYKFISLGNVIMSLADRDDNKFSFRIIDSLLFDSRINLIGRIEFLSGKMFSCEPWDDTDFFERHSSYHSNFMEIAPTSAEETILPVYFGNVCTKIVPVLDMLIGRLIENEERELLLKVVSSFAVLFRAYHDSPVNFVKNLLVYYSESPILDFSVKSKLFSLCDKQGCPDISLLSQECLECIRDETAALNADKFFAVDYLVSLLSKIGSNITFLNSFASISSTCAHLFYEFPNRAQQSIASVSLELLLLPVDEKTLANALIRILIEGALPQRHSIAKLLLSLAILVNTLPLSFGHAIWERIVSLLTHESLNIIQRQVDNDPRVFDFSKLDLIADSNIWSALLVPDVDNIGRYGLQTTLGKLLMLTHAIFHYDSGRQSQFYSYIISLIERLSIRQWNNNIPSTAAIHQLRYLCKLICPIAIYVKAINSTLFTKFTLFVLDQLSEIAKICGLVRSPEVIIQYRKDEEINEALQPVFDLLCWLMLKQNFSDFGTIADIKIKHSNLPDIWRKQISLPGSILLV